MIEGLLFMAFLAVAIGLIAYVFDRVWRGMR